jgi:hypothetical protein
MATDAANRAKRPPREDSRGADTDRRGGGAIGALTTGGTTASDAEGSAVAAATGGSGVWTLGMTASN